MNRRSFLTGFSSLPLVNMMSLKADELRKNNKSAILLWMGGGPSTMDIWDLKPNAPTGGQFRPISTTGDVEICEHMPLMAKQMHNMAIVRSMSTREADHMRGRYYMHTGYVPNQNIEHPSYGAVLSHQLKRESLDIPQFISVGGGSIGAGFLGMNYAPFVVNSDGRIRNLDVKPDARFFQRAYALDVIENDFINQRRGSIASDHRDVLRKAFNLLTSEQMEAFKVVGEPEAVKDR